MNLEIDFKPRTDKLVLPENGNQRDINAQRVREQGIKMNVLHSGPRCIVVINN